MAELRTFPDPEQLAVEAAREVEETVRRAVHETGRAVLGLSGGSTPRRLYELLGDRARAGGPWASTHLVWVDERFVPPTSAESNYRTVVETLIAHAGRFPGHLHPIPTEGTSPGVAAPQYETELRSLLGPRGADLVILGLGPDGHTASLFPEAPALRETRRWVVDVPRSPRPPLVARITTTLPFLNRASEALFLATGVEQADILRRALTGPGRAETSLPASLVRATGRTRWFADAAAASRLPPAAGPRP